MYWYLLSFLEKRLVRACIVHLLRASQNHAERIFGAYLERDDLTKLKNARNS